MSVSTSIELQVEVDAEHRDGLGAPGALQGFADLGVERRAIEQAGESIVVRQILDLGLRLLSFGNVFDRRHIAAVRCNVVADGNAPAVGDPLDQVTGYAAGRVAFQPRGDRVGFLRRPDALAEDQRHNFPAMSALAMGGRRRVGGDLCNRGPGEQDGRQTPLGLFWLEWSGGDRELDHAVGDGVDRAGTA